MNRIFWIYPAVFFGAFALTLMTTPVFRHLAKKLGFMDEPAANHKGHGKATPLLGGVAMFSAWLISLGIGVAVIFSGFLARFDLDFHDQVESGLHLASPQLLYLVAGAALAVLLGLIDDKYALSAGRKFAGQFVVALLAVWGGGVRFNLFISNDFIAAAVTVFWVMTMMNSINFFDNMDGLAAGTIAIAMGFFSLVAALNGQFFVAAFAAAAMGICGGFWCYNANPASIFMGDSGSHFLGYLAAVVAAEVTFFDKSYSLSRFPILMPLFILALPLFDTAMVVAIRTWNRKPFWIGDHNHISHRFVRMGLSRKQAVRLVHLLALIISLGILPVFWGNFITAAVLVAQAALTLGLITFLQMTLSERPDAREK